MVPEKREENDPLKRECVGELRAGPAVKSVRGGDHGQLSNQSLAGSPARVLIFLELYSTTQTLTTRTHTHPYEYTYATLPL
jgi:hypothetical protein